MEPEIVIELKNISKTFTLYSRNLTIRDRLITFFKGESARKLKALDNVNVEIRKGEMFGIIGKNGSGKSTLVQIMNQALYPDKGGKVNSKGVCMRLALGMGFDPELTARQNIYLSCSVLGMTKKEIAEKFDEIISFAELEEFADTPAKYYSSGMKSKLMFSIAVNAKADVFLMDEFFGGVGDNNFKVKADKLFSDRFLTDKTIVIVSHSMETIRQYCDRVMLLDRGKVVMIGKPDEVLKHY